MTQSWRVLIAADKFKGSLTAVEVAERVTAGLRRVVPDLAVEALPVADGGDGTVDAAVAGGFTPVEVEVTGPLGLPVAARFALRGETAVVEMAQAAGLVLLPPGTFAPMTATTYGAGELIAEALDAGAKRILVGVGGSATTDGGAGMLMALGARLLDADGDPLPLGGAPLRELATADLSALDPRLKDTEFVLASDVDNPLTGPTGAASVYGPQKGADPARVHALDAALTRFAELTDPAGTLRDTPGAGAAGGLGYGLLLLGGTVESGVALVLEAVGLDDLVASADVVVTGEGSFDSQSLRGKLPHGVARAAARHGVPCLVLAGRVAVDEAEAAAAGVTAAHSLVESAGSVQAALERSGPELRALSARVASGWKR